MPKHGDGAPWLQYSRLALSRRSQAVSDRVAFTLWTRKPETGNRKLGTRNRDL